MFQPLCDAIAGVLARHSTAGATIVVGCSGGRDSLALLHATMRAVRRAPLDEQRRVVAVHVHHGLSEHADEWARHVERACAGLQDESGDPDFARVGPFFAVERLMGAPSAGESVEAWARAGRYASLERVARAEAAALVLLGHHRRDQAETFLLQALRGGGPRGLAAMPPVIERQGLVWARPWLDLSRALIDDYVQHHNLSYVEDESNADPRFARNRLRVAVWSSLTQAFPQAETSLAHAAYLESQAEDALSELAAIDMSAIGASADSLDVERWASLSPARRVNVLRSWLRALPGMTVKATLLKRLAADLDGAHPASWPVAGGTLRRYKGRLRFEAASAPAPGRSDSTANGAVDSVRIDIDGPGEYAAPPWHGFIRIALVEAGGVAIEQLREARLAARRGGESFQSAVNRPARSLKKQFQAAAIAPWQREAPLLYSNDMLVFVPGLGIDARAQAAPGVTQVSIEWVGSRSAG